MKQPVDLNGKTILVTGSPGFIGANLATSALDLATETRLREALREKLRDTTVILIAQRIASVRHADRIAVIEHGTVTACAPHDELMRISPAYREIYASQMGGGTQ